MLTNVDYKTARAFQISSLFVSTLIIQYLLNFSKAGWIGFAIMMIYAGFDPGTSLHRTFHRFWGAMLGLLLSYILFSFIRLHDELIFIVVPIIVFFAFFSLGKNYFTPTIFTVSITGLGSEYYSTNAYSMEQFFFDYGKATVIAVCISVTFEYFFFSKHNLNDDFYHHLQQTLEEELNKLFIIATTQPIQHSRYLKQCITFNLNLSKFDDFLAHYKYNYRVKSHISVQQEDFHQSIKHIYQKINQLINSDPEQSETLALKTRTELEALKYLYQGPI